MNHTDLARMLSSSLTYSKALLYWPSAMLTLASALARNVVVKAMPMKPREKFSSSSIWVLALFVSPPRACANPRVPMSDRR
ncbi:MAG: hypothetical protein A4E60_03397 [Syntrophorhabdus sp. PtaB.Bin047]|nr:MAG: hypothetical protein A4E60_03397 [Syntrophorhabdus sp. PtaB.Bin047]